MGRHWPAGIRAQVKIAEDIRRSSSAVDATVAFRLPIVGVTWPLAWLRNRRGCSVGESQPIPSRREFAAARSRPLCYKLLRSQFEPA